MWRFAQAWFDGAESGEGDKSNYARAQAAALRAKLAARYYQRKAKSFGASAVKVAKAAAGADADAPQPLPINMEMTIGAADESKSDMAVRFATVNPAGEAAVPQASLKFQAKDEAAATAAAEQLTKTKDFAMNMATEQGMLPEEADDSPMGWALTIAKAFTVSAVGSEVVCSIDGIKETVDKVFGMGMEMAPEELTTLASMAVSRLYNFQMAMYNGCGFDSMGDAPLVARALLAFRPAPCAYDPAHAFDRKACFGLFACMWLLRPPVG